MPPRARSTPTGIMKSKGKTAKSSKPSTKITEPSSSTSNPQNIELPVFFWREYGHEYGFLSQWYEFPMVSPTSPEITYQTCEQYMMHSKATLFSDAPIASQILLTTDPKTQKHLGRQVANFDQKIWEQNREKIVEEGNYLKFSQDSEESRELREKLLETGEREIIEASPIDRIWGVGFGEVNAGKMWVAGTWERNSRWGMNLLGKALMRVRERIREEEKARKQEVDSKEMEEMVRDA